MATHSAITGKVDLDTYSTANNTIVIQFGLAGGLVGNSVLLDDYIDTGNFAEQDFAIPKADLGIEVLTVDEMTITITRSGGSRPTIKFDDFQIEETGDPAIFSVPVDIGKRFHIEEIVFTYADALTTALVNNSMPVLSYDKILGLSALTIGFIIKRVKKGKTLFSATVKTLGAHMSAGAKPDQPWNDGTNTFITLRAIFNEPLILSGDTDDTLTIQINDPMNGLLQFTAAARGSLEG